MNTDVQPMTRDDAIELANQVADEIDRAIRLDRAGGQPREALTVTSPSLAGRDSWELNRLTDSFRREVGFLRSTDLVRRYKIRLVIVVSTGKYTGAVDLELKGTGIEG